MKPTVPAAHVVPSHEIADAILVERITAGDQGAFEALMRRYNGKLFRVARAIVRDDADAEDVLQDA